jgi:hypothetical protein
VTGFIREGTGYIQQRCSAFKTAFADKSTPTGFGATLNVWVLHKTTSGTGFIREEAGTFNRAALPAIKPSRINPLPLNSEQGTMSEPYTKPSGTGFIREEAGTFNRDIEPAIQPSRINPLPLDSEQGSMLGLAQNPVGPDSSGKGPVHPIEIQSLQHRLRG